MASRERSPRPEIDPAIGFYALGVGGLVLAGGHLAMEVPSVGTVLEVVILLALAGLTAYTGYELSDRALSNRGAVDAFRYTCRSRRRSWCWPSRSS